MIKYIQDKYKTVVTLVKNFFTRESNIFHVQTHLRVLEFLVK